MDKFKNDNTKQKNERKTYPFITRVDLTPRELKERTFKGMIEHKKERERKLVKQKKSVIRIAAVAAAIALVVVITPLRGYMAKAAENVYHAMLDGWMANCFSVEQRKSNNGCTVEVVEAKFANDFLYLTINESYDKSLVSRDDKTKLYTMPEISYAGCIKDNAGNEISFDRTKLLYLWAVSNDYPIFYTGYDSRIVDSEHDNWYNETEDFVLNVGYRIYIPGLSSIINSKDKQYTCELNVSCQQLNSSMDFSFDITNIADELQFKSYALERSFEIDGVELVVDKMNVSTYGSDLIIKVNPKDKSDGDIESLLSNFWGSVLVKSDNDDVTMELYSGNNYDNGCIYDFDYDANSDSIMRNKPKYVKVNGQYYIIISNFDIYGSGYAQEIFNNDFTVEVNYLGWSLPTDSDKMDLHYIATYHKLKDISITPENTSNGNYKLNAAIPLNSKYGNVTVTLKEIKEKNTTKLDDGTYKHNLEVSADIKFDSWKEFERNGIYANIYLVNSQNQEVTTIVLPINSGEKSSCTVAVRGEYCTVVDNNEHFALSNDSALHVAYVTESHTNTPNAWFNPKYKTENIDALNAKRFIYFKEN